MKRLILLLAVVAGAVLGAAYPVLAARDSGGTYSLPNNGTSIRNPVSAGQVITKDLWNGTFGDVGTELTDSLSRSGKGPMLGPLKLYNGAATALDLTWDSFQTTGFYVDSGPVLGAKVGATTVFTSTTTATAFPLPVTVTGALTGKTSLVLEDPGAGTEVVTTAAPAALAAGYALTLPAALPAGVAWSNASYVVGDIRTADSGKVYVVDTAGTSTVAPSGTSADQSPGGTARWDYYAPDYTQPVMLSPAGVLGAQPITNSMQAFGAPVEDRDVVIKSYVDSATGGVAAATCSTGDATAAPLTTVGAAVALEATSTYEFEAVVPWAWVSGASAIPRASVAYSGTLAGTTEVTAWTSLEAGTPVSFNVGAGATNIGTTNASNTTRRWAWVRGVVTTTTAGNLTVQFGNVSATYTVYAGACVKTRKAK